MQIPLLREKISSLLEPVIEKYTSTSEPIATMGPLARLTVLIAALSPSLVLSATPDALPQIKSITFSGNGCPSDPKWSGGFNDLSVSYGEFGARLPGDRSTVACQVHIQGTGGSPGWQVALKETWVTGHVWLQPNTKLEFLTTSFFSQDAARTVRTAQDLGGPRLLIFDTADHQARHKGKRRERINQRRRRPLQ